MFTPSISHTRPWPYRGQVTHSGPRTGVAHLMAEIARKYRARRAVQELMGLDDRMLRDIGVGRGAIERAVRSGRDPA